VLKIVASLYRSRQDLIGITPGCAPKWLLERQKSFSSHIDKAQTTSKLRAEGTKSEMQINFKKGGYPPRAQLRKVSRNQCFIFEKNYYSLPKSYVGRFVNVFAWEGKLRIYDESAQKFIYSHHLISRKTGQYQTDPKHIDLFGDLDRRYFNVLIERFESYGPHIGRLASSIVAKYQLFSLRRLWVLRGFISQFGAKFVDQAARSSTNIYQLSNQLTSNHERKKNASKP